MTRALRLARFYTFLYAALLLEHGGHCVLCAMLSYYVSLRLFNAGHRLWHTDGRRRDTQEGGDKALGSSSV